MQGMEIPQLTVPLISYFKIRKRPTRYSWQLLSLAQGSKIGPDLVKFVGFLAFLVVRNLDVWPQVLAMEGTGSLQLIVPLMLAVFAAKVVGDSLTLPIYDVQIKIRGAPVLVPTL